MPGVTRARGMRRFELAVNTERGERTLGLSLADLEAGSKALLVVFQDLTELRRLERDLERIDHLAELGRFSAQAHEIRNPLASVRGAAQMLAGDTQGTPQEKLATLIMREADCGCVVDGYLKLARPRHRCLRPLGSTKGDETLEMVRADPAMARVTIEERLAPVVAWCDASQLKQVLIEPAAQRGACHRHRRAGEGLGARLAWGPGGRSVGQRRRHLCRRSAPPVRALLLSRRWHGAGVVDGAVDRARAWRSSEGRFKPHLRHDVLCHTGAAPCSELTKKCGLSMTSRR